MKQERLLSMSVVENLQTIQENIAAACARVNRNKDEISIIGVTKYVTIERTKELLAAGVVNVGENRAEELLHKYNEVGNEANWHFIGTLQSRKVKDIIGKVTMIHSLDRLSVAKQINSRTETPMPCFVQVNVSGEDSKHGLAPEDVHAFIDDLQQYEQVRVVGLMTMAPHIEDEAEIRTVFKKLAAIRDEVKAKSLPNAPCEYLSMGMSNDYEIAIEEGATHIRIGSILVG